MLKGTLKDKMTNIIALILVVCGSANAYLESLNGGDVNIFMLIFSIGGALIAYFTGKDSKGKAKK